MRGSKILISLTFFSLIVSSFARLDHISISPAPAPSPGPTPGPTTDNVGYSIKEWCNSTDYPDLCVSTISPYLKGKPDLYNALDIAIKSTVAATKTAILAGTKFANSPLAQTQLKATLTDCLGSFDNALDNFQQAQDALPLRDWGTVNTMLSGAITDFGDVEDQIGNMDVPALLDFCEKLTKMTSNCLALSALFDPQPGY